MAAAVALSVGCGSPKFEDCWVTATCAETSAGAGQGGVPSAHAGAAGSGAGGSTAGAAGSAGAPSVPGELGESCSEDDDCASTHCVDRVCCASECDGVCMTCDATGTCVQPEDDAACGTIACDPAPNECTSVPAELTELRCKALGECKTASDCEVSSLPLRTKCTEYAVGDFPTSICDGNGECAPAEVACGGACRIGEQNCCYSAAGGHCVEGICTTGVQTYCDEHTDCPEGERCGFIAITGDPEMVRCVPEETVNIYDTWATGGIVGFELCSNPLMSSICSNGGSCTQTFTHHPVWAFCSTVE